MPHSRRPRCRALPHANCPAGPAGASSSFFIAASCESRCVWRLCGPGHDDGSGRIAQALRAAEQRWRRRARRRSVSIRRSREGVARRECSSLRCDDCDPSMTVIAWHPYWAEALIQNHLSASSTAFVNCEGRRRAATDGVNCSNVHTSARQPRWLSPPIYVVSVVIVGRKSA